MSGVGLPPGSLAISPASLHFGQVAVGTKELIWITLGAVGGRVVVSSATSSNSAFAVRGVTFPLTIHNGETASVALKFNPPSAGLETAQATFVSDASNAATAPAVSLRGHGIAPQLKVVLGWIASPSKVAGYDVYRGATSGGPYTKMSTILDTTASYTDTTVLAGETYYYVVTSVNSTGEESSYSNQASITIPNP
jgi:hypothetical protein